MKLFTVLVTQGSPIVPVYGFTFIQKAGHDEAFLDDDCITIPLSEELVGSVETNSATIVVDDGFIKFPDRVLGADEYPNYDSVLVLFKIRLDRTSPPCILETTSHERHKPVVGRKVDDRVKSSIFQISTDLPVTLKKGQATYLFRCENGTLIMNDITQASWPELPPVVEENLTPTVAKEKKSKWWRKLFLKRKIRQPERRIRLVHCSR